MGSGVAWHATLLSPQAQAHLGVPPRSAPVSPAPFPQSPRCYKILAVVRVAPLQNCPAESAERSQRYERFTTIVSVAKSRRVLRSAQAPTAMGEAQRRAVELAPITNADVPAVAAFLHVNLNDRVPLPTWVAAMSAPWRADAPNHGFMLRDGQRIVGAQLAFYAERTIAGRTERFCNLAALCVLPDFRIHSVRLLMALLAQDGYHFTDLSPTGNVIPLNTRLKFRSLDTSAALIPNLPWPTVPNRTKISADPDVIASTLTGAELELYRDHAQGARRAPPRADPRRRFLLRNVPGGTGRDPAGVRDDPSCQQSRTVPPGDQPTSPLPPGTSSAAGDPGRVADDAVPAAPLGHVARPASPQNVPQRHSGSCAGR